MPETAGPAAREVLEGTAAMAAMPLPVAGMPAEMQLADSEKTEEMALEAVMEESAVPPTARPAAAALICKA